MILTELIKEQAFQCIVMAGAGILVMTLHRIFTNTCNLIRINRICRGILEIGFWIGAAILTTQFLYYCAYGKPSFHAAVSFAGAALLWKKFFCGIIDRIYKVTN